MAPHQSAFLITPFYILINIIIKIRKRNLKILWFFRTNRTSLQFASIIQKPDLIYNYFLGIFAIHPPSTLLAKILNKITFPNLNLRFLANKNTPTTTMFLPTHILLKNSFHNNNIRISNTDAPSHTQSRIIIYISLNQSNILRLLHMHTPPWKISPILPKLR